jgi:hypothetical protein
MARMEVVTLVEKVVGLVVGMAETVEKVGQVGKEAGSAVGMVVTLAHKVLVQKEVGLAVEMVETENKFCSSSFKMSLGGIYA